MEGSVFVLGAIICLTDNSSSVCVEIVDEVGKAMVIGGHII